MPRIPLRRSRTGLAPAFATLVCAATVQAADGTWTTPGSGTWSDGANWAGAVPADGSDFTANFTSDIAATATVTLDSNRTIGNLVFSDNGASGAAWSLASSGGAVLTLDDPDGATITTLTNASVGAGITAANGFTKLGAGTLTLTGTSAGIAGAIHANAGILESTVARLGTATIHANSAYGAGYSSGSTPFLRVTNTSNQILANNIILATPGSSAYYALQKSGAGSTLDLTGIISGGNANSVLQLDTATAGDATTHFNLAGANELNGQIRLNRGRMTLSNASALGNATLYLQTNANATDGNLSFNGVSSVSNNLIVGTTLNQWINTGAANVTLSGTISSATAGSGGFSKMGAGTLTLTGANTYRGITQISGGTLALSKDTGGRLIGGGGFFGTAGTSYVNVNAGGTFETWNWEYGASNALGELRNNNYAVAVNGGTVRFVDTFSALRAFTVGTGGATLEVTSGNTYTKLAGTNPNENIIRVIAAGSTLTLSGAGNGEIQDALGTSSGSGSLTNFNLAKNGSGTWTLTGANTYTGTTTVNAGTLLVNGANNGAGAVTVAGGVLGGSGSIAGTVIVNAGGTLAPGSSIESLSTGSATLNAGAAFAYEFSASNADLLVSTGGLTLNNATLSLISSDAVALGTKFTLINYGGTAITSGFTGLADDSTFTAGLNTWQINYNDLTGGSNFTGEQGLNGATNYVTITSVVPEPGAALLGGLGLLGLLRRRRVA